MRIHLERTGQGRQFGFWIIKRPYIVGGKKWRLEISLWRWAWTWAWSNSR